MGTIRTAQIRMACATCRQVLSSFNPTGDNPQWVHARSWDTYDHEPEPVPATNLKGGAAAVCDFCFDPNPVVIHFGKAQDAVTLDQHGRMGGTKTFGAEWSGCTDCATLIRRRQTEALIQRVKRIVHDDYEKRDTTGDLLGMSDEVIARLIEINNDVIRRFIASIYKITPVPPPPAPPINLKPYHLPKVRERLVELLQGGTVPAFLMAQGPGKMFITGTDYGDPEQFGVQVPKTATTARIVCSRLAADLDDAELYWISGPFTKIATTRGLRLPEIAISTHDIPSEHGLVVWAEPVYITGAAGVHGIELRAASWHVIPGGLWITAYAIPEQFVRDRSVDAIRTQMGYLFPVISGGLYAWDVSLDPASVDVMTRHVITALIATWVQMKEPRIAAVTDEPLDKGLKRRYARQDRTPRPVRVVNLNTTPAERPQKPADGQPPSDRAWDYRMLVSGHHKRVAFGPGRAEREWRWIGEYWAGPDGAPVRFKGDKTPVVKVLK